MTEIHKRYRLTSMEKPTDEMLQSLMEDVAAEARKSMAKAEAEKKRRLQAVADEISALLQFICHLISRRNLRSSIFLQVSPA